jgi:hypothetical protein
MNTVIDRFCSDILPRIHHQIKWLKVQSTSMERLLLAADYSNLSQLDIFIPHEERLRHFNGESTLIRSSSALREDSLSLSLPHHPYQIEQQERLNQTEIDVEFDGLFEVSFERTIVLTFDRRVNEHCHHTDMVHHHHTRQSEGSTAVLF